MNQVIDCYVYDVYDGDTLKVLIDYKDVLFNLSVRLLDIDTPEISRCSEKEKLAGLCVRDHLKVLLEHKVVRLRAIKWDKWGGRINGHVWVHEDDDESVSDYLLQKGFAQPYDGTTKKSPWSVEQLNHIIAQ